jgi:hypothetical protein
MSIDNLKKSDDKEKVLLWLGKRLEDTYIVEEVFEPTQITDEDFFRVPEYGMSELMDKLRVSRKMIVAQIHTHPFEAFHSLADDTWAIVRHKGAYSLVLPYFASTTNSENFLKNVATFVLDEFNSWIEVDNSNIIIE